MPRAPASGRFSGSRSERNRHRVGRCRLWPNDR